MWIVPQYPPNETQTDPPPSRLLAVAFVDIFDEFRFALSTRLSFDSTCAHAYIALAGSHTFREFCVVRHKLQLVALQWIAPVLPDRVRFMARGNFGERLKRERELREVSPNEIVVATRISQRFLEALENEQWEKLPGGVFNRGFVRAIARYLGLDEENLLAEYDLARGDQAPEAAIAAENRIPRPSKWSTTLLALGVLLALAALAVAGVYGFKWFSAWRRAHPVATLSTQTVASAVPVSATSGDPHPPASNPVPLDLSVSTSFATHVRVVADGKVIFDSKMPAGDNRHFSGETSFEVTAADSSAVLLELNGQAMPPIGPPGASGTIVLSQRNLRPANGGNAQP